MRDYAIMATITTAFLGIIVGLSMAVAKGAVPSDTPPEERTRYVLYSHIFEQEIHNCIILAKVCELSNAQEMQSTAHCPQLGEDCAIAAYLRWQKVKEANGWEKWDVK